VSNPGIDPRRLLRRLRELSTIGRAPGGGVTRPGFSQAAAAAVSYVAAEARHGGLTATIDAAGNLLIRQPAPSGRRTLLTGSHLDTVLNGGWLDGAYGVIAALEAVQVATDHRLDPGYDMAAVAFANEEGARFPQAFWGSMALAGTLSLPSEPMTDDHGQSLREALSRAGGNMDEVGSASWSPGSLAGYVELHIEQGPVLEEAGVPIGVVDAITGRTVLEAQFAGRAAHAGTTPMEHRADALLGAAHLVIAVNQLPARGLCRVATAGRLSATPGSPNTIAGSARITIDLRESHPDRLARAEAAIRGEIAALAAELGLKPDCHVLVRSAPAATDPWLRQCISSAARDLKFQSLELPSGAGHDAQIMAAVTPIGMIFVPSIGGVSHVPHEDTAPTDLIAGAQVLLSAILRAGRSPGEGDQDAVPLCH
jgi:N-carbamoyl-L-amino-acid hydrolase